MDPYRFDEWTKALVSGTSRRTFLAGLLKAGAVAIGLSAASAQAARADDDDDDDDDDDRPRNTAARCQRRLERCSERSSFKTCSKCLAEATAAGCFVPAGVNPCRCTSDAYCADRNNSCTLDICSSNRCYNVLIEDSCVQCRKNRDCPNGGKCCEGRCCPAGNTCQVNNQGVGVCCEKCGNGTTCCQQINFSGDPNRSRVYVTLLNGCVGQEGRNFNPPLPTGCCDGAGGSYQVDANGNPVFNPDGTPVLFCVAPARSVP